MLGLSYGGQELNVPNERVSRWVEENLTLSDIYEHTRKNWWQGHSTLPNFPGHMADRPIELNRLYWPNSASRWASFYAIATPRQVEEIVRQAFPKPPSRSYPPLSLILSTPTDSPETKRGVTTHRLEDAGSITATMYLLPPRPLSGFDNLFLLPLVDKRFMLWSKTTGDLEAADDYTPVETYEGPTYVFSSGDNHKRIVRTYVSGNKEDTLPDPGLVGSSWTVEIKNGDSFTVKLTPSAVDGKIDGQSSITLDSHQRVTIFSDGVTLYTGWGWMYHLLGEAIGQTISYDPISTSYCCPSNLLRNSYDPAPPWIDSVAWCIGHRIVAGLDGSLTAVAPARTDPDGTLIAGGRFVASLNNTLQNRVNNLYDFTGPEQAKAVFPRFDEAGAYLGSDLTRTATAGGRLGVVTVFPPIKEGPADGQETAQYATRWASDFLSFQTAQYDVRLPGIVPVTPSSHYGNIIWSYRMEDHSTRIQRTDYPSSRWPVDCCRSGSTTTKTVEETTINTGTYNNYETPKKDIWRITTNGGNVTLTGLKYGTNGRILQIKNAGPGNVVIPHQSGSSSSANQVTNSSGASLTLQPNESSWMEYSTTTNKWDTSKWYRLTVQERDGSPSIPSPYTLEFDQGDRFVVQNPSAGVARIRIAAPTQTFQTAALDSTSSSTYVTTMTQSFTVTAKPGAASSTASVLIHFCGYLESDDDFNVIDFRVQVDGVTIGLEPMARNTIIDALGEYRSVAFTVLATGLSPGARSITIDWKVSGTNNVYLKNAHLTCLEVF